jgi:hypothetical protein
MKLYNEELFCNLYCMRNFALFISKLKENMKGVQQKLTIV